MAAEGGVDGVAGGVTPCDSGNRSVVASTRICVVGGVVTVNTKCVRVDMPVAHCRDFKGPG